MNSALVRAFHRHDPRRASLRMAVSVFVGALVTLVVPASLGTGVSLVAGWDAGAFTLLSLAWIIIGLSNEGETRHRAAMADPGRTAVWLLVLASSTVSLFASILALRQSHGGASGILSIRPLLCLGAVALAWSTTHTACTLRYAHLYYRDDNDGVGGLGFPGERPPDYIDFAYFAFTVGMCFQVSDVTVTSRAIRRTVLVHALLSFAYNTAVVALALNLVTGLLS